jgi:AAA+ ATPase superfamily predicted ATPase
MRMFVDRVRELEFLQGKWAEEGAQLVVIYGRRRVGKTFLLKEFLRGRKGAYVLLTADSVRENLRAIKQEFARVTGKRYFLSVEGDLTDLLRLLVDEVGGERVAVALDEFQYLMQLDPSILSKLQKAWDEFLKDSNIFMILCGSSVGMMERLLEYKNPLYGRRTGQWKVEPFDIRGVAEMFPSMDFEEIVKTYAVFGGVPYYLSLLNEGLSVEENIKRKVLSKGEVLYEEPEFILREEFREPRIYKLILKYLALGYVSLGELVNVTGLDRGNLSRYLDTLELVDIITYELPYGKRKRGRYYIKDNFMNFWFRYVYPNKGDLELGMVNEVFEKIKKDLNTYYGIAFEKLVLELLRHKVIDFNHNEVRRWWHKGDEIDAIAVRDDGLVAIEVKWGKLTRSEAEEVLSKLEAKVKRAGFRSKTSFYLVGKEIEGKEGLNAIDLADLQKAVRSGRITPIEHCKRF